MARTWKYRNPRPGNKSNPLHDIVYRVTFHQAHIAVALLEPGAHGVIERSKPIDDRA